MTNPTAPLLNESDVDAMEARCGKADRIVDDYYAHEYAVAAALNDIPALIRDWRALKASDQHNYELWLNLKERHRHRFSNGGDCWKCRATSVSTDEYADAIDEEDD